MSVCYIPDILPYILRIALYIEGGDRLHESFFINALDIDLVLL